MRVSSDEWALFAANKLRRIWKQVKVGSVDHWSWRAPFLYPLEAAANNEGRRAGGSTAGPPQEAESSSKRSRG